MKIGESNLKENIERIQEFNYAERLVNDVLKACRDMSAAELKEVNKTLHDLRDQVEKFQLRGN